MRQVLLIWGPIAILHMFIGMTALFVRSEGKIRFGPWVRTAVVDVSLFTHTLLLVTALEGTLTGPPSSFVVFLAAFWYVVYACFMFRYEYRGSELFWFNGLIRRRVKADEIRGIVMLSDKRRVAKIDFLLIDRRTRLRNDLPDVAVLVKRMASDHSIPISNERLRWWSI